jgi:ABC-type sugar transport system permease subunit
VIITSVIASFQVFSQVFVMTNGGPNNSTTTIVHQIYRTAFVHLEMGYASAMAWLCSSSLSRHRWSTFACSPEKRSMGKST